VSVAVGVVMIENPSLPALWTACVIINTHDRAFRYPLKSRYGLIFKPGQRHFPWNRAREAGPYGPTLWAPAFGLAPAFCAA
jgi:hypothetical protein